MKTVREVAIRIPNKPGSLSNIVELLSSNGIYTLGFSLNISGSEGNLSLVASDPSRTQNILESSGFSVTLKDRIVVQVPQHPGGLNAILRPLKLAEVNLENMYYLQGAYAVLTTPTLVLAVDDNSKALEALSKEWIKVEGEEVLTY
jgi:hypothetical protein